MNGKVIYYDLGNINHKEINEKRNIYCRKYKVVPDHWIVSNANNVVIFYDPAKNKFYLVLRGSSHKCRTSC